MWPTTHRAGLYLALHAPATALRSSLCSLPKSLSENLQRLAAVREEEAVEMERISEEARAARHLVDWEGGVLPTRGGGREAQGLDVRFFYLIGVFLFILIV